MTAGTVCALRLALVPALAGVVAGCGQGSTQHTPALAKLPLAPDTRIVTSTRRCDPGANAFCGWQLVVVGPRYPTSEVLLRAEHRRLLSLGWTGANADTGEQHAADSPGHKLRVTYATPFGDLKGIDLGWIRRSWPVTLALSRAMFERSSALSMLLEEGPA
jgi:hypothetical protein